MRSKSGSASDCARAVGIVAGVEITWAIQLFPAVSVVVGELRHSRPRRGILRGVVGPLGAGARSTRPGLEGFVLTRHAPWPSSTISASTTSSSAPAPLPAVPPPGVDSAPAPSLAPPPALALAAAACS